MLNTRPRMMRLSDADNVAVATGRIEKDEAAFAGIAARARIPFGHKMAIEPIA